MTGYTPPRLEVVDDDPAALRSLLAKVLARLECVTGERDVLMRKLADERRLRRYDPRMPCTCDTCLREGPHDHWCTVHLADFEDLEVPPCDCGLREGVRRTPANAIVKTCEDCSRPKTNEPPS